jgi:hypothetical protein
MKTIIAAARDRPLLFSAPMVRAILDGRKTQTRRVLKLPKKTHSGGPIYERPDMGGWEATTHGGGGCFRIGRAGERISVPEEPAIWHRTCGVCMTMPWKAGDRAWVRETWAYDDDGAILRAGERPFNPDFRPRWRSPIHMPRRFSRITLLIEDVRVQRLQDISEEDAVAEGIDPEEVWKIVGVTGPTNGGSTQAFAAIWDRIHSPGAWGQNPWVCALTFQVKKANIDNVAC